MKANDLMSKVSAVINSELTAYAIAKRTGLTTSAVAKYKRGESKAENMSLSAAMKFEDLYNELKGGVNMDKRIARIEKRKLQINGHKLHGSGRSFKNEFSNVRDVLNTLRGLSAFNQESEDEELLRVGLEHVGITETSYSKLIKAMEVAMNGCGCDVEDYEAIAYLRSALEELGGETGDSIEMALKGFDPSYGAGVTAIYAIELDPEVDGDDLLNADIQEILNSLEGSEWDFLWPHPTYTYSTAIQVAVDWSQLSDAQKAKWA